MATELDEELYAKILEICREGDTRLERQDFAGAAAAYRQAFALLPPPFDQWSAATWTLTALGDACFQNKDFFCAQEALEKAMRCPGALENPFIHLRRGETFEELGRHDRAIEDLTTAYALGGARVFEGEPPRYYQLLQKAGLRDLEPPPIVDTFRYEAAFVDTPPGSIRHIIFLRNGSPHSPSVVIPVLDVRERTLVCEYQVNPVPGEDTLTDEAARELIVRVLFGQLTDHYYAERADQVEFINLDTGLHYQAPYSMDR